jgi:glutathione S-transferase
MIKLYGHPFSLNARKAHWALEELELPYEYQLIELPKGAHKTPHFLALNPAGKIPVLTDDAVTLAESNAIVTYLADAYGNGRLLTSEKQSRARILQWLFWQIAEGSTPLSRPWYLRVVAPIMTGQPFDEAAHALALANAAPALKFLNQALEGHGYLVGDAFSAADICTAEAVGQAQFGGVDFTPYANLQGWLERLATRPAFQKTRPQMPSGEPN